MGRAAAAGRGSGKTPYADWLAAAFEEWLADKRRPSVRMFESIIATTRGGASRTESLGLEASDVAVIETDGAIEQADSIKVAYDGARRPPGLTYSLTHLTPPPRTPVCGQGSAASPG